MDHRSNRTAEETKIREVLGTLDWCVEAAVEAKDTGQWSEAYEKKKVLDERIDSYLENGKMLIQSGNVGWKFLRRDWFGAIVALLSLGLMGRNFWKRRRDEKNNKRKND